MTDDSKAMALIRELCRKCNDDELYRVWFLLTGIMLTKRTADETPGSVQVTDVVDEFHQR